MSIITLCRLLAFAALACLVCDEAAAAQNCYMDKRFKPPLKVCDDVNPPKKRGPEVDGPMLDPIVVPNSGAFGPPSSSNTKPTSPCPPGRVLNRSGVCVAAGECRPGYTLGPSGQCVPAGQCRPGRVLSRTGQCVPG